MADGDLQVARIPMGEFRYKGWSLFDAIDAIKAHDGGAFDSGVKDEELRHEVRAYLGGLPAEQRRLLLSKYARRFLTDESLSLGYGLDDVLAFIQWINELGIDV